MRWLVAGANGMLGQDLCEVLEAAGHDVTRRDLPELDILDAAQHDGEAGAITRQFVARRDHFLAAVSSPTRPTLR